MDADYKSDSKNFQTLQTLAGDHSATAQIDVLKPNDKFDVRGRVAPYGAHGTGTVDRQTTEAEKEAVKNSKVK